MELKSLSQPAPQGRDDALYDIVHLPHRLNAITISGGNRLGLYWCDGAMPSDAANR